MAIPLSGKEVFTKEVNTMIGGLLYATRDAKKKTEEIVPIIQELGICYYCRIIFILRVVGRSGRN